MAGKEVAIRKRQQIENAGRTMFLWVIGAAVIVGIALVLSVSLFERLQFNQEILGKKNETASNLHHNNEIVGKLKEEARLINTDLNLVDTPRDEGREPISVVLDALPSQPNSSALGASLQQKILNEGVSIDALTVDPISGVEGGATASSSIDPVGNKEIGFSFTISVPAKEADKLKLVLTKLEKSIRIINVKTIKIEQQSSQISLLVEGVAYFSPEVKVELQKRKL